MVSEFVCLCHSNMVDPVTGKTCCMILKYGKNYDGYWTREDVTIQLKDIHTTFIKLHPVCLPCMSSETQKTTAGYKWVLSTHVNQT